MLSNIDIKWLSVVTVLGRPSFQNYDARFHGSFRSSVKCCNLLSVSLQIYRVFQKDLNDLNLVYFTY